MRSEVVAEVTKLRNQELQQAQQQLRQQLQQQVCTSFLILQCHTVAYHADISVCYSLKDGSPLVGWCSQRHLCMEHTMFHMMLITPSLIISGPELHRSPRSMISS